MLIKEIQENVRIVREYLSNILSFGMESFWKRMLVCSLWALMVLGVLIAVPTYLIYELETERHQSIKDLQKDSTYNRLLIVKDALKLCSESIKNNHHYKERYCNNSLLLFEQSLTQVDEFYAELITAKAYEEMSIYNDATIRYMDSKKMLKRENTSFKEKIFDMFFNNLGLTAYVVILYFFLSLPFIMFYMASKRLKEEATIFNKQFGNSFDGS